MNRQVSPSKTRSRIMIGVDADLHERIRSAAVRNRLSVSAFVLAAIEQRLWLDGKPHPFDEPALGSTTDEVLAELWDNDLDAQYDRQTSSVKRSP